MGNCAKLKWNRKRLKLTQKEFAEKVGLSTTTLWRLEHDETAWASLRDETVDKIQELYECMSSWQPDETKAEDIIREIHNELEEGERIIKSEKYKPEPESIVVPAVVHIDSDTGLSKLDEKTLTLIEFAYEGLKESKTHAEFVANIGMIKRIVSKY